MLNKIRTHRSLQLGLGLAMGIVFGFLLQRGGVTTYDTILGQLLLQDFTVVKVMLSAIVVGMVGVHALRSFGLARLHPKAGSWGSTAVGGLIFGAGFAVLVYCPGTIAGDIGQGALDALLAGVAGIVLGAWLFAVLYPKLAKPILSKGDFGTLTLPEALNLHAWLVVPPVALLLTGILVLLELSGH